MRKKRKGAKWQILLTLFAAVVILGVFVNERAKQQLAAARQGLSLEPAREFQQLVKAATAPATAATATPALPAERVESARARMNAAAKARAYLKQHFENNLAWSDLIRGYLNTKNPWTPEQWREAEELLAKHQAFIGELRKLATMEGPLYPVDFDAGLQVDLDHLSEPRAYARILGVDALLRAQNGDFDGAIANLKAQLGLGKGIAQEPYLISQLVENAIQTIAFSTVGAAFPPGALSNAQRQTLIQTFTDTIDRHSMATALSYETSQFRQPFGNSGMLRLFANLAEARHLETMGHLIEGAQVPYYQAVDDLDTMQERIDDLPFYAFATRNLAPALDGALKSSARFEAQIGLLQIGLTLEQYHSTHGTYPPTLDTLAPMLGEVPVDPFTGASFGYTPNTDSFTLYSLGIDLEDDGGIEDGNDGDLVWRWK